MVDAREMVDGTLEDLLSDLELGLTTPSEAIEWMRPALTAAARLCEAARLEERYEPGGHGLPSSDTIRDDELRPALRALGVADE